MTPSLIDTHCHLNYDYSPKSLDDLIREGIKNGISHFVTIGTDLTSIPRIQEISDTYDPIFHTIGIHPQDAPALTEADLPTLRAAAQHPKCRAIGEIGLDSHYPDSNLDLQLKWLEAQLELAQELKKPVIIHSREAEPPLLAALKRYVSGLPSNAIPGVIHCFSGSHQFGLDCIEMGFYISLSGILTFKNAEALRSSAQAFPLERILVETDAPYLAPVPFRGKKCEPGMVKFTAHKLAELRGLSFAEIAATTTANAKKVFAIP